MALAYVLAVLLPPVAVAMAGTKNQIVLNIVLCFLGWIPAVVHAVIICGSPDGKRRFKRAMSDNDGD